MKQKAEKGFNSKENQKSFLKNYQETVFIPPNSDGFWKSKLGKYQKIDGNELMIAWFLPEMRDLYRISSLEYWNELVSSDHKEGLIFSLMSLGLIENLFVVNYEDKDSSFFAIHIVLSDSGFNKIDIILQYVANYLKLIADEGITQERWQEMKIIRDLEFNYKKPNDEIYAISDIARNMKYIPKDDISNILKFNTNMFLEYSFEAIHI